MTSPDLIRELQASKPVAPDALRMRVREIAPTQAVQLRRRLRFSLPRPAFVLVPAAAALVVAIGAAGVIGLARSGGSGDVAAQNAKAVQHGVAGGSTRTNPAVLGPATTTQEQAASPPQALGYTGAGAAVAPTQGRAQDVQATLTVKVADSDHVSKAAQDALDLTRSLGGHVVSASVATGDQAQATLTVRIPVARTQDAVARLSALGTIVSQQVSIQDLQERLDALVRRARSVRAQIVKITARLDSQQLSPEQRAALELRRQSLRSELRSLRQSIRSTGSEARFATIELSVVTPESQGVVPAPSRLDRSLDKALEVVVWEGIVALVALLVGAPLAILALAAWVLRRMYRKHEEDRLLATS